MKTSSLFRSAIFTFLMSGIVSLFPVRITFAAGAVNTQAAVQKKSTKPAKVDVDLTKLSATMVYAEVFNILSNGYKYDGKTVRMRGAFSTSEAEDDDGQPIRKYRCVIKDATACCAQGIEFAMRDKQLAWPADFPKTNSTVTVVGRFYCDMHDASVITVVDGVFEP